VHALFGKVKINYLAQVERMNPAPAIMEALEVGTITRDDLVEIGEFSVPNPTGRWRGMTLDLEHELKARGHAGDRLVRSAILNLIVGGTQPTLEFLFFDIEDPSQISGRTPNPVAILTVQKKQGTWFVV
jgi:hypothetical protein